MRPLERGWYWNGEEYIILPPETVKNVECLFFAGGDNSPDNISKSIKINKKIIETIIKNIKVMEPKKQQIYEKSKLSPQQLINMFNTPCESDEDFITRLAGLRPYCHV